MFAEVGHEHPACNPPRKDRRVLGNWPLSGPRRLLMKRRRPDLLLADAWGQSQRLMCMGMITCVNSSGPTPTGRSTPGAPGRVVSNATCGVPITLSTSIK